MGVMGARFAARMPRRDSADLAIPRRLGLGNVSGPALSGPPRPRGKQARRYKCLVTTLS